MPGHLVARPALFRVTTDIVNPGLEPFTVTVPAFGNTLKRDAQDGFEPVTFRTQIMAGRDAPDRIYAAQASAIHHYNSWGSGYLDGGSVRVYRVMDRRLHLVREDTIAEGGTVIEQWNVNDNQVLSPDAREGYWAWASWSRPGTTDWFTVMAVDKAGNWYPGAPVALVRPDGDHRAHADQRNTTVSFRADRAAQPETPLKAPQHIRAEITEENLVRLVWDPVDSPHLAGYLIAQSDVPPDTHRGVYLQLNQAPTDPAKHIKDGDLIIVDTAYRAFERRLLSNRLGNLDRIIRDYYPGNVPNDFHPSEAPGKSWRLVDHDRDTPVTEPGRTYLEMTLREGDVEKIGKYNIPHISTTEQEYYPVPHAAEYVMDVWMKADRDDAPPVVFEFDGDRRVGGFLEPFSFQPTTEWKQFRHRFSAAPSERGAHAYLVLTCRGPATYAVDNYRVYRADAPYLALLPEEEARYRASGMMAMRTHGPIKTGETTYSMEAFTNPGGVIQGIFKGNTLPQQLAVMEKLGTRPWLQVEYHMSPDEWLGFVEYLAAPYDPSVDTPETKPWAAKRYAQGRAAPWVDAFDRIYFELANETWNRLFAPWIFHDMPDHVRGDRVPRGEVYGMMHDHVVDLFRSSPYWNESVEQKFVHVLGGWTIGSYNQEALAGSRYADFITVASYNGGWDEGEGPPQKNPYSYFSVLSHPTVVTVHRSRALAELVAKEAEAGRTVRPGTYEAGPGYAMDGLNNARVTKEEARAQDEVMKSKVAGTATLDAFLTQAYYGFALQNFFTFAEGNLWKSHAKWWRGGQAYPSFLWLQQFNHIGTGDMLRTETLSVSTVDYPALHRRSELKNGPLATVYATRKGNRVSVFCINRAYPYFPDTTYDGVMPFELELPFKRSRSITLYRLSGELTDHNIDDEQVVLEQIAIAPNELPRDGRFRIDQRTGGDERGLPAGETYLYVFEGTDLSEKGERVPLRRLLDEPVGQEFPKGL